MLFKVLFASVAALALAACATPSSYHAFADGEGGYAEQRIAPDLWRIEYRGADSEPADVVERYMLRRAAELTLASGFEWFIQLDMSAAREAEVVVEAMPARASAEAVWRPRWRRRSLSRWTDWDPRGAEASESLAQRTYEATRVVASADIQMGCGDTPPGAFNAEAVLRAESGGVTAHGGSTTR